METDATKIVIKTGKLKNVSGHMDGKPKQTPSPSVMGTVVHKPMMDKKAFVLYFS